MNKTSARHREGVWWYRSRPGTAHRASHRVSRMKGKERTPEARPGLRTIAKRPESVSSPPSVGAFGLMLARLCRGGEEEGCDERGRLDGRRAGLALRAECERFLSQKFHQGRGGQRGAVPMLFAEPLVDALLRGRKGLATLGIGGTHRGERQTGRGMLARLTRDWRAPSSRCRAC